VFYSKQGTPIDAAKVLFFFETQSLYEKMFETLGNEDTLRELLTENLTTLNFLMFILLEKQHL